MGDEILRAGFSLVFGKLRSLVDLLEGLHRRRAMLPSCGSGLRAACRPNLGVLPEAGPNLLNLFTSWEEKIPFLMYLTNQTSL